MFFFTFVSNLFFPSKKKHFFLNVCPILEKIAVMVWGLVVVVAVAVLLKLLNLYIKSHYDSLVVVLLSSFFFLVLLFVV